MGRSASCFKIIACAGDSTDNDELQAPENKGSSEKSRWSFRKRSVRHRVLSNTAISEAPYSADKGSSDSASLNFQSPDPSTVPEKISVIHCTDEKAHLPTSVDSKASETTVVTEDKKVADAQHEESVVIVMQTAVRGFLAQKELLKMKNLVKLQAAVRGHLVRKHAIGTLRCVQAIVKMQALVRARQTRLLKEGMSLEKKTDGKYEKANSKILGKENSTAKPNVTYTSINKLLSNKFARQLMESTPKERPIHIKCDPAKPNAAWNWLERWMYVSSVEPTPLPEYRIEPLEREKNDNVASQNETVVSSQGFYKIADSESNTNENDVLPSVTDENMTTHDEDDFKFQETHLTSALAEDNSEQPQYEKIITSAVEPSGSLDSLPNQNMESNVKSQFESTSLPYKVEIEGEQTDQPKHSMKRYSSESLDTVGNEGKKSIFGSRKVSNPSFLAAHSKFEGLSSTTNSNRLRTSSNQDGGVEPKMEPVSSSENTAMRAKDLNLLDDSVPNNFRGQRGGSECGTELSVTSTLDSPDTSEVGVAEPDYDHEAKYAEQETCNSNIEKDDVVTENASSDPVSDFPDSVMVQPEKLDGVRNESANSIVAAESQLVEKKPERSASDVPRELDSETGGLTYRSSPEASPRSRMTVPESQGTPSQLSVTDKKNRRSKSASNKKRKSLSATKSPSNPNNGSVAGDGIEQLAKDQKNGKRRNSFGSTRADHADKELRDSNNISSIPHFMQATESARAKLQANSSPRSSPDVQDREYVKKRHSLPGVNGRQGSPRIQRSMSQAQPGSKGNGSLVVHEKKWQR